MKYQFLIVTLISCSVLSAQDIKPFSKEGKISSGYGYANSTANFESGSSIFVQMSYRAFSQFSLAIEFEQLNHRLPGYFSNFPISPNIQKLYDHYFSLLIKYHLPLNSKFQAALSSGWSFYVNQNEYYDSYQDATSQVISYRMRSYSGYGIPFLLETHYPVWKNLGAGIRLKYNFNPGEISTYSAGVGVSLVL